MQGYNNIDQRIHQLCQILTKANRTFVPKQADDSHTNLYFDSISQRIYGHWIAGNKGKIIFSLNLGTFHFEWMNDELKVIQSHSILNKTSTEIEKGIAEVLSEIGLQENGFRNELHFEIAVYPFLNDAFTILDANHLKEWKAYRALANHASLDLLGIVQATSEIRIWPHHFDTGIYTEINNNLAIGFGLAMEDSMVGTPYFYYSAYGLNGYDIDYSNVSNLTTGKWFIDDWKGAVLPLTGLKNDDSDIISIFIKEVTQWFLKH
jgi:hypothetical protein